MKSWMNCFSASGAPKTMRSLARSQSISSARSATPISRMQ